MLSTWNSARSPDLNPIENVFNIVKKQLEDEAIQIRITNEPFEKFKERVLQCLNNVSVNIIDRTLTSMPKRIDTILKGKAIRLKY